MRLDHFLTALLPDQSRSQVQRLIKDGRVHGPVPRCGPARAVHAGQTFTSSTCPSPSAAAPEPEALPLRIVYEDPDIVVLDKPAGMVVHPAAGHSQRHARQRAAAPRQGSERHRRRAAAGHRASARSRHVGPDGGRQERRGAPGALAAVPRSRGREGIHRAGLGRGAGRQADRRADRPRSAAPAEDVDAGAPRAERGHARDVGRDICTACRCSRSRSPPAAPIRFACT